MSEENSKKAPQVTNIDPVEEAQKQKQAASDLPIPKPAPMMQDTPTQVQAAPEKKIVTSDPKPGLPMGGKPGRQEVAERVSVDATPSSKINKDTIFYLLYLLLSVHFISRNHLKQMLAQINQEPPKDIAKWLVEEAAKA